MLHILPLKILRSTFYLQQLVACFTTASIKIKRILQLRTETNLNMCYQRREKLKTKNYNEKFYYASDKREFKRAVIKQHE